MSYPYKLFLLLLLAASVLFCCTPARFDKLVDGDEFNYTGAPDSSRWNLETGNGCPANCGWGNNEVEWYTRDLRNARVENGSLVIHAVKVGEQWTSARITSQEKMNFTYGRLEFRAKLPLGVGTWPALWMLGEGVKAESWPACGEIDVMEHVGKNPGIVLSALHTLAGNGDTPTRASTQVNDVDTEYHLYEVNWTEDKIEFFVDGNSYYKYEPQDKSKANWPFNKPFFVIMNIAMGGNLGGHQIDPALNEVKMEVDYVRIYQ